MKIGTIIANHFGIWKDVTIQLPPTGLVAVTGDNGEGKSSIIEAVTHACWNSSPRGPDRAWMDGQISRAFVELPDLAIKRVRKKKGTPKLSFVHKGTPDQSATNTKAQEALDSIIGSFNVWRRTSVFSSADAAHFSLATDKTRKLLFEEMLGLLAFDDGLRKCRKDLSEAQSKLGALRQQAHTLSVQMQGMEARIRDAETWADPGDEEDLGRLRAKLVELKASFKNADDEAKELFRDLREIGNESRDAERAAEQARQKAALLSGGQCPTCEQTIGPELQAKLHEAVRDAVAVADAKAKADAAERADIQAELDDVTETRDALLKKVSDVSARGVSIKKAQEKRDEITKAIASVRTELDAAKTKASELEGELEAAQKEVDTLKSVEQVLGLKGPRSSILAGALAGVEAVANVRLSQIGAAGYELRLRSYKDNADGKSTTDAITLEMRTPKKPYWHSYSAASGGQRRRVDVAVILGFAEISQGEGTLFFDEVFDALDLDGQAKVVSLLRELAAERCVVVISHSESLITLLQPDVHLVAANGTITGS